MPDNVSEINAAMDRLGWPRVEEFAEGLEPEPAGKTTSFLQQLSERCVVQAMIGDRLRAERIVSIVEPPDFVSSPWAVIFGTFHAITARRETVNLISFHAHFGGLLDKDLLSGFLDIVRDVDLSEHLGWEAALREVVEAAIVREFFVEAASAADQIDAGGRADVVRAASERLAPLRQRLDVNASAKTVTARDAMKEAITAAEERAAGNLPPRIATGFPKLDEAIRGYRPGQLIVIGARTGVGKTSLMLRSELDAALGAATIFVTAEQPTIELSNRTLAISAQVPLERIMSAHFAKLDAGKMIAALERISQRSHVVEETSLIGLQSEVRTLRERIEGPCVVFVDYLQRLTPADRHRNSRELEVAESVKALKNLALDLAVTVVVGAQLNREVEKRSGKKPQISDLRESGAIEQEADVIALLWREEGEHGYTDTGNLYVRKNRHGPPCVVPLVFNAPCLRFDEMSNREEY